MTVKRTWSQFPETFRQREMSQIAQWILTCESGSVLGLGGSGKSNLLGFLSARSELLTTYLPKTASPIYIVPVDLNNLPVNDLSTLYRIILRSFYENKERFEIETQQLISQLYLENKATTDPFVCQSALRELLFHLQAQLARVVMIIDRFDHFVEFGKPEIFNTLRGLRDAVKDTLCFIVGMRDKASKLFPTDSLGELYELIDSPVCWVGGMSDADTLDAITRLTSLAPRTPDEAEITTIYELTGNYPSLVKATCQWWLNEGFEMPVKDWSAKLLAQSSIQFRLGEIWDGLSQQELSALSRLSDSGKLSGELSLQHQTALVQLYRKKLIREPDSTPQIKGALLAAHIANNRSQIKGRIWWNEVEQRFFWGTEPIELTGKLRSLLKYFLENWGDPLSKEDIWLNVWADPEEMRDIAIETTSYYTVEKAISDLRRKIEPNPKKPCYIITLRAKQAAGNGGGYSFFPDGRRRGL